MDITYEPIANDGPKDVKPATSGQDFFDGVTISPQFLVALKDFLKKNIGPLLRTQSSSGFATIGANATHAAIPHGLVGTPTLVSISTFSAVSGGVVQSVYVSTTLPTADATNIYVDNSGGARPTYWAAAIL